MDKIEQNSHEYRMLVTPKISYVVIISGKIETPSDDRVLMYHTQKERFIEFVVSIVEKNIRKLTEKELVEATLLYENNFIHAMNDYLKNKRKSKVSQINNTEKKSSPIQFDQEIFSDQDHNIYDENGCVDFNDFDGIGTIGDVDGLDIQDFEYHKEIDHNDSLDQVYTQSNKGEQVTDEETE